MKGMLKIWLFMLAGAGLGIVLSQDNGYVLMSFGVYSVEMSLALLGVLGASAFGVLYLLIRTLVRARHLPHDVRDWNQRRGSRLSQQAMTRGLIEMSEGNWAAAERRLVKFADRSETPLLNYLVAARAAQLQGEHDRRDAYIRLAHEHMPSANIAVSLTQAELQLADQQLEQALATLRHLRNIAPKHTYVLRLLRRLYEQLGDWEHLKELLPELRKRKVEDADELHQLEIRTHRALLDQAFLSNDAARLQQAWNAVPKGLRSEAQVLADYAGHLQERGADDQAEPLLHDALKQRWDPTLIEIYGQLDISEPGRKLAALEKYLPQHADDPVLLLALGRLSLRAKLWGKARAYLEACIGRNGPADAYRELGHLLEGLHEPERALEMYRRGLSGITTAGLIPLPEEILHPQANRPMLDEYSLLVPPPHGARPDPEPSAG